AGVIGVGVRVDLVVVDRLDAEGGEIGGGAAIDGGGPLPAQLHLGAGGHLGAEAHPLHAAGDGHHDGEHGAGEEHVAAEARRRGGEPAVGERVVDGGGLERERVEVDGGA